MEMKRLLISYLFCLISISIFAQDNNGPTLKFNSPYKTSDNRSVILPADRIPDDFLGCTLGVTTEIDALKKLNKLGIRFDEASGGASDIISIRGNIECEGAKFVGVDLWFYNNTFWKIVFIICRTDSKVWTNTIKQKYSKFPCVKDRFGYIRYIGRNADIVHNEYNLQYTISGGSCIRFEE